MKNEFLAKSNPRKTIQEHSLDLIKNFEKLKNLYPNIKLGEYWEILKLACLYHDLGKMNTKFQNRVGSNLEDKLKNIPEVWHNYLSPAFLPKEKLLEIFDNDKEKMKVLYQAIYYHHNYEDNTKTEDKQNIIEQDLELYFKDFNFEKIVKIEKLNPSFDKYVMKKNRIKSSHFDKNIYHQFILTKGLLNKLDYSASAGIDVEKENKNLFDKTKEYLKKNNYDFNDLQKYFIENRDENNIVVASTGMGKTEAALAWIGNENKGFFTLPLRVSINAIYERIKDEINFEEVILLHSEAYGELLRESTIKNEDFDEDVYTMARQWSYPLTICTLDQILDFIFKYDGYEWKLATLSYSKLVIDEIQMYDAELLAYLIVALKYIAEIGGKFSIFTATFPNFIKDILEEQKINFKLSETRFLTDKKRHFVKILEKNLELDDIVDFENKKVLIIVNTVGKAQKIYKNLKEDKRFKDINKNLLHSRFIRKDRKEKEQKILKMGQKNNQEKGIWITTQVVEASLDIDFDILYTELQDISSLFQRMGRVFRNREYDGKSANVFIFVGDENNQPSGVKKMVDGDIFKNSLEELLKFKEDFLDENKKCEMIDNVYSMDKIKNYYQKVEKNIKDILNIPDYELGKNEERLRKILNIPIIPEKIYQDNQEIIEENYKQIKSSKDRKIRETAKDKIKNFIVDLPKWRYDRDYKNSKIVPIRQELELDKITRIKVLNYKYNSETGLGEPAPINNIL